MSINQQGWQLTATFDDLPAPCRHLYEASVTPIHDQQWLLEPAGPAGLYDVHLVAVGPGGGNAVATFRWATVNDGARPFPRKTCT